MPTSHRDTVAALGQAIAQRVGQPRYDLWFRDKTKLAWDDDQLTVGVPNHFYQEWMEKTFGAAVRAAAADALGRPQRVRFAIDAELFQAARRAEAAVREAAPAEAAEAPRSVPAEPTQAARAPRAAARPRRWRALDEFVVGPCNRVAHASALAVVESPGQDANPLVLHGPVGTGKTHLLEGACAGLRRARPDWQVRFVPAEEFTNRFVHAMHAGKLGSFRKYFRECDALLLDDVHFLATKRATQEEFLHTLDVLLADGRQVVVTCDCHPRLEERFLPELTDRLLGGAVWGVTPPELETRLGILRARAGRGGGAPLPEEVLRFLAEQLRGNVRELEGAVHGVQHFSKVAGRRPDLALVREALGELLRHSVRVVQLGDVERVVCEVLRLQPGSLQAKQRDWRHSHPRMVAMFLARKHTAATYADVGRHFGGRTHSTAVAAEKKVRAWLAEDGKLNLGDRQLRVRDVIERAERELWR